ncbi:hypothetical protein ACBP82_02430 [Paenalcaligenes hominis]|uniref:hypothetical protein n=1 Tax=Paenalcaligenes hominis TaxID=643674 RepID=UPI003526309B
MGSYELLAEKCLIDGDYDLKNLNFKFLLDNLNSITWESLFGKFIIQPELVLPLIDRYSEIPLIASRLKDIYFISYFRDFLSSGSIAALISDMNNHSVSRYRDYEFCKTKMFYIGILELSNGDERKGIFNILKANQEYFRNNVTTPFLSYSRSVSPSFLYDGLCLSDALTLRGELQDPAILVG